jgi:hypothetical protein
MRWKISHRNEGLVNRGLGNQGLENHGHHSHDPRQIDLVAIVALLILIVAAFRFYNSNTEAPSASAFIVPSQSVHW